LAWHLAGEGIVEPVLSEAEGGRRIRLRGGDDPAEVLLVPVGSEGQVEIIKDGDSGLRVVYYAPADGRLCVVTLFLPGLWARAEVGWEREGLALWIAQGEQRIVLPLLEWQ
jgi:hypothetical protein